VVLPTSLDDPGGLVASIRAAVHDADPLLSTEFTTMPRVLERVAHSC
jgi:hypothetical protein